MTTYRVRLLLTVGGLALAGAMLVPVAAVAADAPTPALTPSATTTPGPGYAKTISPTWTRDGSNVVISYAWEVHDAYAEWITTQDDKVIRDDTQPGPASASGTTAIVIPEAQISGRSHFVVQLNYCASNIDRCVKSTDLDVYIDGSNPAPGATPTPAATDTATPTPTPTVTVTAPAPSPRVVVHVQKPPAATTRFASCTDAHRFYSGGIAKVGTSKDKRGKHADALRGLVLFSTTAYRANKNLDTDRDGILCEKH